MSRAVVVVRPATPIAQAEQVAHEHGVHHLPVVEGDGELIGMICLCDIRNAAHSEIVADRVSWPVVAIGLSASLDQAVELMRERGIGCAPVISPSGSLVGVITRRDLRAAGAIGRTRGVDCCAACGATHSLQRAFDPHELVFCADCLAKGRKSFAPEDTALGD